MMTNKIFFFTHIYLSYQKYIKLVLVQNECVRHTSHLQDTGFAQV